MRKRILSLVIAGLTLCTFCAQSQTALIPDDTVSGMTTVGGEVHYADTLHVTPVEIAERNASRTLEPFDIDIQSVTFVPKGQWIAGVSISYTQSNQNNYQFLILEKISGDTYSFKATPMLGYAFKDDMAAGLKFGYKRSLTKLENADVVIDSESSYSADHMYSLAHNYYATMFLRNYFSIGRSKRFGFFNEVQCQLGGGQSKITTGVGSDLSGAYESNFSLDIGLVPGIAVFLNNYSALEVNIGVLGFSYNHTKTINDQIYVAHRKMQAANFKINLFSITFGVSFYI